MKTPGRDKASSELQPRSTVKRRAAAIAAGLLVIGGCAMVLSWGMWGVFATCTAVTLAAAMYLLLARLPRYAGTGALVPRLAGLAAFSLAQIGWALVALLNPEYTIGWTIPGRGGGGIHVFDVTEAHLAGWTLLSTGIACAALTIAIALFPRRLGEVRPKPKTPERIDVRSGNPAVRDGGRKMRVRDHLR